MGGIGGWNVEDGGDVRMDGVCAKWSGFDCH